MEEDPIILPSANKHGVVDEDLLHALEHAGDPIDMGDGMAMYIGPDRAGRPTEVGVIDWYGTTAVAHGMTPARTKFMRRR